MDSENNISSISPQIIVHRDDNGTLNNGSHANERPDEDSPSNQKGVGLKKWRRIRRDHAKDRHSSADSSKILKRGLATSNNNQSKPQVSSPDMKQQSGGSIGSENTQRMQSLAFPISIPNSTFVVGSGNAGNSDSEDRSSKFSTASSRQPRPLREKTRITNMAAKGSGSSVRQLKPGKGHLEGSKKLRGEKVKIEEENSLSSLESDSVNSSFVFANGPQKQGERGGEYGGENGDEANELEKQYIEEGERGDGELVAGENDGAIEQNRELRDQDCLADSLLSLQSVQEALGREVEKLRTIGREATPSDCSINNPISLDHLDSQSSRQGSLETQIEQMAKNEKVLKRKLEESRAMLEAKELRITQLQAEISHSNGIGKVDEILKLKLEAEVEYLVLTRRMQTIKNAGSGPTKPMIHELEETESKTMKMEEKIKEMKKNKDVEKMKNRVWKVTLCFATELVLLVLVLWAFVLELLPETQATVPT